MNVMPIPKMAPLPLGETSDLRLFRGIPAIVQDFQYRPGSLEVVLFWSAPQNMQGVDGWRIFQDKESNLIQKIDERSTRQLTVKMPGNSSAMFYVCAVSAFLKEGPKRGVLARTNSDQMVLAGTTGATTGAPSVPDPDWQRQPTGGHYRGLNTL